jgi:ABC-type transport system substrate-binding protein
MYRNPIYSTGGRNYCHVDDKHIDELIDAGAGETDPEKRQEIYTELQKLLVEEMVAMVPVAQPTLTLGTRAGVTGARLFPARRDRRIFYTGIRSGLFPVRSRGGIILIRFRNCFIRA